MAAPVQFEVVRTDVKVGRKHASSLTLRPFYGRLSGPRALGTFTLMSVPLSIGPNLFDTELKSGRKSMVLKSNGEFRNLYRDRAARMVGNFKVEVSPFEILIHDNYAKP